MQRPKKHWAQTRESPANILTLLRKFEVRFPLIQPRIQALILRFMNDHLLNFRATFVALEQTRTRTARALHNKTCSLNYFKMINSSRNFNLFAAFFILLSRTTEKAITFY